MSGVLVVNPIKAKLLENHDFFGKQDPYIIFHLGDQQIRSKVCKSGGKLPSWNDSILLKRKFEPVLYIEIKDKDFFSDDLIGVTQIDLSQLPERKANSQWYPIYHKKKSAGQILIEVIYTPDEPLAPANSGGSKPIDNKAIQANKPEEVEIIDPLKKSTYLAEHITPIVNSVKTSLHIDNQIKYPTFDGPNYETPQPEFQQPNRQQSSGQSPSNQQFSNQQQPGYQQPQPGYPRQPNSQQAGYQRQSSQQQPGYQQPGYQQPGYQQPGRQGQYYQQSGCGQPNFNQGGIWQPNGQPGVWQPNNGQCYPMQPNYDRSPYNQGAQFP